MLLLTGRLLRHEIIYMRVLNDILKLNKITAVTELADFFLGGTCELSFGIQQLLDIFLFLFMEIVVLNLLYSAMHMLVRLFRTHYPCLRVSYCLYWLSHEPSGWIVNHPKSISVYILKNQLQCRTALYHTLINHNI